MMKALFLAVVLITFTGVAHAANPNAYTCQKQIDFAGFPTLLEMQLTLSKLSGPSIEAVLEFRMTNLENPPPKESWHVMCFSAGPMAVSQSGTIYQMDGSITCIDGSVNPLKMNFDSQSMELTSQDAGDAPYNCKPL